MNKDSRLSFRISPKNSSRIDLAVRKSAGQIKDRSELGTVAVEYYLRRVLSVDSDIELMGKILLEIAGKLDINTTEIQLVRDMLYDDPLTPIENHPKFEELMILRERLPREIKKQLTIKLFTSKYGEMDRIFETYSQIYKDLGDQSKVPLKAKQK